MVTLKSCFETVAMETVQTCLAHVLGHGRIQRVPACAHVMHACTPQFSPAGKSHPSSDVSVLSLHGMHGKKPRAMTQLL